MQVDGGDCTCSCVPGKLIVTLLVAAIDTNVSCLSLSCCAVVKGKYWS